MLNNLFLDIIILFRLNCLCRICFGGTPTLPANHSQHEAERGGSCQCKHPPTERRFIGKGLQPSIHKIE